MGKKSEFEFSRHRKKNEKWSKIQNLNFSCQNSVNCKFFEILWWKKKLNLSKNEIRQKFRIWIFDAKILKFFLSWKLDQKLEFIFWKNLILNLIFDPMCTKNYPSKTPKKIAILIFVFSIFQMIEKNKAEDLIVPST